MQYIFNAFLRLLSMYGFSIIIIIMNKCVIYVYIFPLGIKRLLLWDSQPCRLTLYVTDYTEYCFHSKFQVRLRATNIGATARFAAA